MACTLDRESGPWPPKARRPTPRVTRLEGGLGGEEPTDAQRTRERMLPWLTRPSPEVETSKRPPRGKAAPLTPREIESLRRQARSTSVRRERE